ADAGGGSAQLVRDVGEQLGVALEEAAQPLRHLVERAAERADLIAPMEVGPGPEIALSEPPRDLGKVLDGTRDRAGEGSGGESEDADDEPEDSEEAHEQLAVRDPEREPQVPTG